MTRSHRLSEQSFLEFQEAMAEDPVVLLPFASQEEQGPHAPMGDYRLTRNVADLAAKRSGAIVAPTIPFGYADFFGAFAGGIQLRTQTFKSLVEDVATSFLDHGVNRLIIVNGHTTNSFLIDEVMRKLQRERGVYLTSVDIWQCLDAATWQKIHGPNAAAARGHGADPMTSVYMHFFPDQVNLDRVEKAPNGTAFGLPTRGPRGVGFGTGTINMPLSARDANETGILSGDPSFSSAEKGAQIVEHIVALLSDFVAHLKTQDPCQI
ncbi:MAG: creatininase family protein [Pelagimonas sp.]|uniref:creatininase family protein n=1 Tax=Pelagimonas sp. TaxID=2073170 RepID=UPI003D6BB411